MRRLVAFALVALAGCSFSGDESTIDDGRVDELVLQPADVGTGFHRTSIENLAGDPIAEVRYRRVPPRVLGPLTIRSTARVLASSEVADKALQSQRSRLKDRPNWLPIDEPGLGDESFAATVVHGGVRSYTVFWRDDNATASLDVRSLQDRFPFAEVFELAEKQQRRLAAAADLGDSAR